MSEKKRSLGVRVYDVRKDERRKEGGKEKIILVSYGGRYLMLEICEHLSDDGTMRCGYKVLNNKLQF